MKNITFHLYIDAHSILNLNADFFSSIHYNFENSHVVKIEVRENDLCRLIKRDLKCGLRINQEETRMGVITEVRKINNNVLLTCEFKEALCVAE